MDAFRTSMDCGEIRAIRKTGLPQQSYTERNPSCDQGEKEQGATSRRLKELKEMNDAGSRFDG
jgi:hypothetical protein